MTTPPVQVERRVGQRFTFHLPVSVQMATGPEGSGSTHDLSSRGSFFFTDVPLTEGAEVGLTLRMPSEITLGESMLVRCSGRVLRVANPAVKAFTSPSAWVSPPAQARAQLQAQAPAEPRPETTIGVAVQIKSYEYLPDPAEASTSFDRIAALHGAGDADRPPVQGFASSRAAIH